MRTEEYSQGSNTSLSDCVGNTLNSRLDPHYKHSELARRMGVFFLLPQNVSRQCHAVGIDLLSSRGRHLSGPVGRGLQEGMSAISVSISTHESRRIGNISLLYLEARGIILAVSSNISRLKLEVSTPPAPVCCWRCRFANITF